MQHICIIFLPKEPIMTPHEFHLLRKTVETPSGRISFIEKGTGPAAIFVHGVPLNGYHWRHALEGLADLRRCIAPDLMGLGYSEVGSDQPLDFEAQAQMLFQFLDALDIQTIDLVGNDSGGAVAQILATNAPDRIRSLTLTNCDTHDNWPPEAFMPIVNLGKAEQFGHALASLLANPEAARSPQGLGVGFEFPERLTEDILAVYLSPVTATEERRSQVSRYVAVQDCAQTVRIEDRLKAFDKPTLIIWADRDVFFPAPWAEWLARTIPGTRKVEILNGARLFFPEERPEVFCGLVREHWQAAAA
jgi:pimeloyl-ACP methyl ester carboxylesterase